MKPVNKTAALSVYGGHRFLSKKKIQTADTDVPIPTRKMHRSERIQGRVDLRGIRFGRFTVIGISANDGRNWVVRCSCGIYTERKTKTVLNPNNQNDMCELCREHKHFQNMNHKNTYGKYLDEERGGSIK